MNQSLTTPVKRSEDALEQTESVKRQRLNHETPSRTPATRLPFTPSQMAAQGMTPRTNRVKQRLAQAAATPRRLGDGTDRQATPRDILKALSRVLLREKAQEEEEQHRVEPVETQDGSPTTSTRSSLSARFSGLFSNRLSDATGLMGKLTVDSRPQTPTRSDKFTTPGRSARSIELYRRLSTVSRLSNATRMSEIFHTTTEEGEETPRVVIDHQNKDEQLPEMDLEFGEEIGGAGDNDEDFGGEDNYEVLGGNDSDEDFGGDGFGHYSDQELEEREIIPVNNEETGDDDRMEDVTPIADYDITFGSPGEHYFSDEDISTAKASSKKPARRGTSRRKMLSTKENLQPSLFPRSFLKSLVASITGDVVDKTALEELVTSSNMYFDQLADDLIAYTDHCKRKTVDTKDVVQLMRRQRLIKDSSDILPLAQRHLPEELISQLSDVFTIRAPKRRIKAVPSDNY